jgi:hypothetical protein
MLLVFSISTAMAAASPLQPESVLLGERPTVNGEPTVVDIAVYVIDIDEIDDVSQRFSIDMFIVAAWHDPRLVLPEEDRQGAKRFLTFDQAWSPRVLILNDRGVTPQLREGVEVDDLGNVRFMNRFSGQLSANLEFQDFPFDVQRLPIDIVSYEYANDELLLKPYNELESATETFSLEGWRLTQLENVENVFVTPLGTKLPRVSFSFEAERDSDYYVLTMLVPMSLIIFMAWTVFWLQPHIVPPRIAISTASIFSLIALGVSIRLSLPKISYLTKADIFVLGCTLMVFIALAIAVLGSRWANSERMEQALKANAIARWVYMLLFFLIAGLSFFF